MINMCVSETTIDLMQELSIESTEEIYSFLMRDNSLDTGVISLAEHSVTELCASGHTIPAQRPQIENTAIAA
jgi:hypothetical protein